jgi:hypothetical protein
MLAAESVCAVVVAQQRDVKCRLRAACELLRCDPRALRPETLRVLLEHLRALSQTGEAASESTLQRFLVPSLAAASTSAAKAVDRLQQTRACETDLLRAAQQALHAMSPDQTADPGAPVRIFRVYCNQALDRLEDEELLLLPLARQLLPTQQWVAIASALSETMTTETKLPATRPAAGADDPALRVCPLWGCGPGETAQLFRCRAVCAIHAQSSSAAPDTRQACPAVSAGSDPLKPAVATAHRAIA